MPWSTPSFEEIKMDAEARGYGLWVEDEPAEGEVPAASEQGASAGSE